MTATGHFSAKTEAAPHQGASRTTIVIEHPTDKTDAIEQVILSLIITLAKKEIVYVKDLDLVIQG